MFELEGLIGEVSDGEIGALASYETCDAPRQGDGTCGYVVFGF